MKCKYKIDSQKNRMIGKYIDMIVYIDLKKKNDETFIMKTLQTSITL